MEIGTKVSFSAAHRLTFHKGQCKNLHGHNWKVEIQIQSLNYDNMVVDFGLLKQFVKDSFDHKVLVYEQDDILLQRTDGMTRAVLPFETTAENIAKFLSVAIKEQFLAEDKTADVAITVYENDDSFASEI
jgi:6-pyruvoyltetrahydropterin/6-carboxytetrahydropterin synthase